MDYITESKKKPDDKKCDICNITYKNFNERTFHLKIECL